MAQIQKEALRQVLKKMKKDGFFEFHQPIAEVKAKMIYKHFKIDVVVTDAYTIKPGYNG